MAMTVEEESGNVRVIRVNGLLKKSELDAVQVAEAKKLAYYSRVKLLIIVENFEGWEGGVNWGDMSFYAEHGDKITKIAIVGDPKREADLMMFMGAGIRPSPLKFFPPQQLEQAQKWLADKSVE
ncbi:MAG: hypothetical protein A2178_01025 [Planctomycetes bacterium GWC2_49_10]|nr:MAG: hypothetical protein A2178_01025 [Planctomycetes bacterium GWC2_49_10]